MSVAEAAWYSTQLQLDDKRLKRVPALLKVLVADDALPHSVPFEHNLISFRVTADIATHIHCLKHRIGVSISSQSARWGRFKDYSFHTPDDWPEAVKRRYAEEVEVLFSLYLVMLEDLEPILGKKRALESARFILPYGTQITWLVTFNFLSFIHFQNLRNSDLAQKEVHELAAEMLRLVKETGRFENSLKVWGWG